MRYAEPGDSEEMAQAQEMFFTELSKYINMYMHFFIARTFYIFTLYIPSCAIAAHIIIKPDYIIFHFLQ